MGLLIGIVLPGVAAGLAEGLIVGRTRARGGCFVLPGLAALLVLLALGGYGAAVGWDQFTWGFYAAIAGSALLGALAGGGVGLLVRRRRGA